METTSLKAVIAKNLRRWRQEHHLTQEQVAERLSVSPRYYSGIERAERNLTIDSVDALAMALEIATEDLLSFH